MLAVLTPTKLTGDVQNIRRFAEAWRVDCMLDTFLFAHKKVLNKQILMKQNRKQNKVHDEQIIVTKIRQEKFKRKRINYLYEQKERFLCELLLEKNLAMFTVYK